MQLLGLLQLMYTMAPTGCVLVSLVCRHVTRACLQELEAMPQLAQIWSDVSSRV
jgi:hypothetical protein